ncbi:MAG: hypothetical protein ACI4LX_01085 [Treponema sp.]
MKKIKVIATLLAMSMALAFVFTGCQQPSSGGDSSSASQASHEHTFAEEWKFDAGYHWHAATCEHTDEVSGKATHTFGEWKITLEPTEEAEGKKERTCTVCSYKEEAPVAKLNHIHDWKAEWTYDETYHWHACNGCSEVSDKAEHTFGACTEESGIIKRTCSVCNYEKTVNFYSASDAKVGDIVLKDGTFISYENFTDEMKDNAAAVIVRAKIGDTPALGVGIHHSETGLVWCTMGAKGYNTYINYLTSDNCTDGSDGWSILKEALETAGKDDDTSDAEEKYPAWNFCNTYGTTNGLTGSLETDWYLPALAELTTIYKNKATIDASLSLVGGSQFGTSLYWSCCQSSSGDGGACRLSFANGITTNYTKNYYNGYVCSVRAFN